jgi:hypothetical protein
MAAFTKFQDFAEQVLRGVHNFGAHTFKAALTNAAPAVGNTVLSDIAQIANGGGYAAGGYTLDAVVLTETAGVAKVMIADEVIAAAGGAVGPFRFVAVYNDTAASKNLVCFYDYGSSITLNDGETLTIDFDGAAGVFTLS